MSSTGIRIASSPEFLPFYYHITSLGWLSFVACLASILGSFYVLYTLKLSLSRLKRDSHYVLRFLLALFLICNRISNTISFIHVNHTFAIGWHVRRLAEAYGMNSMPAPQADLEELRSAYEYASKVEFFCHLIFMSTLYGMMILMMFLTLDRYMRVTLVVPHSIKYYCFKSIFVVYTVGFFYVVFGYFIDYIPRMYRIGRLIKENNTTVYYLVLMRQLFELAGFGLGVALYYYFNIRLIMASVRGVHYKDVFNLLFSIIMPSKKQQQPNSGQPFHSESETDEEMQWANKQVAIIQAQKAAVTIKMIFYFFIVIIVDMSMFAMMVLVNLNLTSGAGVEYMDIFPFVASWIVFHVLIIYELLDLFLRELKKAKFVKQVQEAKKDPKKLDRRRLFLDSMQESSQPELVDLSLFSDFVTETGISQKISTKRRWFKGNSGVSSSAEQPTTQTWTESVSNENYMKATSFISSKE